MIERVQFLTVRRVRQLADEVVIIIHKSQISFLLLVLHSGSIFRRRLGDVIENVPTVDILRVILKDIPESDSGGLVVLHPVVESGIFVLPCPTGHSTLEHPVADRGVGVSRILTIY